MLFFFAFPVYDTRMFIAAGSKIQPLTIVLALALLLTLVISAFRISRMAPQYGRRRVVWFFISLFFTAIPATLVFWRDYARSISARDSLPGLGRRLKKSRNTFAEDPSDRCPHCGVFFTPAGSDNVIEGDGNKKCPNCKMAVEGKHFA